MAKPWSTPNNRLRMNITSAIVHTALIFLGALFAPLALGQLAPSLPKVDPGKDARAAAKAPLDPVATRARVDQELGRLKEQQERAFGPFVERRGAGGGYQHQNVDFEPAETES